MTELEWIKAVHRDLASLREDVNEKFSVISTDITAARSLEPRIEALEEQETERERRSLQAALAFIATLFPLLIAAGVAVAHV